MSRLRHLLVVTTAPLNLGHSHAAETVVALLSREFARQGIQVTVGLSCANSSGDGDTVARMESMGVRFVQLPGRMLDTSAGGKNTVGTIKSVARSLLLNDGSNDRPQIDDAAAQARAIDEIGADAVLLFWDTIAEYTLPIIATPAFGYLARPPQEASMARTRAARLGPRNAVDRLLLMAQARRHMQRMRHLRNAVNICALDVLHYAQSGVPCSYVPNTWDDPVGETWQSARKAGESRRQPIQILGNIGQLNSTGNSFGLSYLGNRLMPLLLARSGDIDWRIAICGTRQLRPEVAEALDHPRIEIKGFVDDIDDELLSSAIFLLVNNAGPYSGGYTRVIYAFALGSCLIAHKSLALSMPELVSGENCLLAGTPEGIARHVDAALRDSDLRARLGAQARRTYETSYAPARIAQKLLAMMEARLGPTDTRTSGRAIPARTAELEQGAAHMPQRA